MALTQPILNSITAFDATQAHTFKFVSIGGDQVVGSQLTVYNNQTGVQVYQGNYTSYKFEFVLPANILTNGTYYNATIATINNATQFSEPSNPVAFYCYTTPVLTITNIPNTKTIGTSNYTFQGNYMQQQGELLNGYQFVLYNSNKEQLTSSGIIYDTNYSYTFTGFENDTDYYIELQGTTINGTAISSGLLEFNVRYIQPSSFAICDLANDCDNGYIQVSSNIVAIDGTSEPTPPTYIDNKEIDLTGDGNYVNWAKGFNISNDFTMRIWGRDFNDNEPIVNMTNNLNTQEIPNKIDMTYMNGNVIQELPQYVQSYGVIANMQNAVNEFLIGTSSQGNSVQQSQSKSTIVEGTNLLSYNTDIRSYIDIDNEGNSYQATSILPDIYTQVDYIESTGTQYIDTLYKMSISSKVKMKIKRISPDEHFVFGSRISSTLQGYVLNFNEIGSDNGTFASWSGGNAVSGSDYKGVDLGDKEIEISKDGLLINNVSCNCNIGNVDSTLNFYLFGLNQNGSLESRIRPLRIYYVKIYTSGILVRDMIPCYRNSDNVIGMYDTVNNVFYTNAGTGTFLKGNNTTLPNPDYPQEIKSCGDNINLLENTLTSQTINGLDVTVNSDKTVTINGTANKQTNLFLNSNYYTFDTDIVISGCPSGGNPNTYSLLCEFDNKTTGIWTKELYEKGNGLIIPYDINYKYKFSILIRSGITINNLTFKPKIEQGPVATPYSPYNQGSITEVISNKNLIKFQDFTTTSLGVTAKCENGKITLNGTATSDFSFYLTNYINILELNKLIAGKSVTFSTKDLISKCSLNIAGSKYGAYYVQFTNKSPQSRTMISCETIPYINIYAVKGMVFDNLEIALQIELGTVATSYLEHQEQDFTISTQQPFRAIGNVRDKFIKVNGVWNEEHNIGEVILNGTESAWTLGISRTNYSKFYTNYLKKLENLPKSPKNDSISSVGYLSSNYFSTIESPNNQWADDTVADITINASQNVTISIPNSIANSVDKLKTWLSTHNTIVDYILATPTYIPCTAEQITQLDALQNLITYQGVNNLYSNDIISPYMIVSYSQFPSPSLSSPIYNTGDIGNLINVSNQSVGFTQDTVAHTFPTNSYELLPNRIYTFSFDYTVTSSNADLYYGLGYGTSTQYSNDLTLNDNINVLYETQNTGSNIITFTTPSSFSIEHPYLWINFAKTLLTADIGVDISNVSLNLGDTDGTYQDYGKYNIPITLAGKNLYNFANVNYILNNNTTYSSNGNSYTINFVNANNPAYIQFGYSNNLSEGLQYGLSYFTSGNLTEFHLYITKKGSSEIMGECTVTNGIFVAPPNYYDLMLQFGVDSSDSSYYLDLWNIQIEQGNVLTSYEPYSSQLANIVLDEPLRSVGNVRDCILTDTINLLNPTTQTANVKENTTYNFYANVSTNYTLDYINSEGNVISSLTLNSGTNFTTPLNCVEVMVNGVSASDIATNQLQIEYGNVFDQYYPYITEPSLIRNIGEVILNGTEGWTLQSINSYGISNFVLYNIIDYIGGTSPNRALNNRFQFQDSLISNVKDNGLMFATNKNLFIRLNSTIASTVEEFKTWLSTHNTIVDYQLANPTITPLTSSQSTLINNFKTSVGVNNLIVNSSSSGYNITNYSNNIISQDAVNAYVLLKCYNQNNIPYMIHSNYIDLPSPTDKIFIWTRRVNNIFDLQIENLGKE